MVDKNLLFALLLGTCHPAPTTGSTLYQVTAEVESSTDSSIKGTIDFSQAYGSDCVHVNGTIYGLPDGLHGFHVHQYGDIASDTDLSSLGAHFVPYCTDRRRRLDLDYYIAPPDPGADSVGTQCYNDSVHGLPPSNVRQSGDMGNIMSTDQVASYDADLCQRKMSLYDDYKSILGRSVVVHELEDTGEAPFGNAGNPLAAGVIGLADLGADGNGAVAADVPQVSRVMCYLRGDFDGPVLLEQEFMSTSASLTGVLSVADPPSEDVSHSFHFHTYGQLNDLGPIWNSSNLQLSQLVVPAGKATLRECSEFEVSSDLLDFVGRALTIHSGPTSSSPTVAAGICGLAHPESEVSCVEPEVDDSAIASLNIVLGVGIALVSTVCHS